MLDLIKLNEGYVTKWVISETPTIIKLENNEIKIKIFIISIKQKRRQKAPFQII